MGKHSGKKRGAPRRRDLTWKLKVVDALMWLGGGSIDITAATAAVSQIPSEFFEDNACPGLRAALGPGSDPSPSYAGALRAIASGNNTVSDALWNELEAEAQRIVARSYPPVLAGRRGSKAERRLAGLLRTVRRRLLAHRHWQVSPDVLGQARTNDANAKALRQAYYQRGVVNRLTDADVVWEVAMEQPGPAVLLWARSEPWILG